MTITEAKQELRLQGEYDEKQLKKAYKDQLKLYHPDGRKKDEEKTKRINLAYEILYKITIKKEPTKETSWLKKAVIELQGAKDLLITVQGYFDEEHKKIAQKLVEKATEFQREIEISTISVGEHTPEELEQQFYLDKANILISLINSQKKNWIVANQDIYTEEDMEYCNELFKELEEIITSIRECAPKKIYNLARSHLENQRKYLIKRNTQRVVVRNALIFTEQSLNINETEELVLIREAFLESIFKNELKSVVSSTSLQEAIYYFQKVYESNVRNFIANQENILEEKTVAEIKTKQKNPKETVENK